MITDYCVSEIKKLSAESLVGIGALRRVDGKDGEFVCPFCGNGGNGTKNPTGIKPKDYYSHIGWKCHRCGEKFDNISILAAHYGLHSRNDFEEICRKACEDFGITFEKEKYNMKRGDYSMNSQQRKATTPYSGDIKLIYSSKDKLSEPKPITNKITHSERGIILEQLATDETALENFVNQRGGAWRGLPLELLKKHGCRFIKNWLAPSLLAKRPDAQKWATTSPRVLIPASTNPNDANFLARLTVPIENFSTNQRRYIHEKDHAGTKTLFNADALIADLVIAAEGYIDAMSLELAGFNAVALGSAEGYGLLVKAIATLKTKPQVLILLDPDDAGRKHAPILKRALDKIDCPAVVRFLSEENSKLDANKILVEQGLDTLRQTINNIIDDAQKDFSAFEKEVALPSPMSDTNTDDIISDIREMCSWKTDRKGNRTSISSTFANIKIIFENDPNLKGLVGFDQFTSENVFLKQATWRETNCIGEQWTDEDDAQLRNYLRENYAELKEKQLIDDSVISFSHKNSFNAVKNFYENLPTWDGTPRLDNLFVKFLGAEDCDYTHEVTSKWAIGAIARIYHPGCDFQWAPVLQGAQRIGKSRLVKMLGGKEGVNPSGYSWHVALKDSVDDAHAVDAIQRGGIIEIEEFSAARRAEINALKSFISADEDTRRFAYDKRASTRKRHGVFIVTCNDQEFLRDPTGNARFWIIKCTQEKFARVEGMTPEYIRQVWAEAYFKYNELFKDGFDESKLKPSLELELRAEEIAEEYLQDDGLTGEIKAYLEKPILPPIIWNLLNKDERRKFFVDNGLTMDFDALKRRFKNSGKHTDEEKTAFEKETSVSKFVRTRTHFEPKTDEMLEYIYFYGGSVPREHICAAEVFNEAISNGDKRKAMYRINEILSQLDGWTLGKRLRNVDPEYREQKKPYYRNSEGEPAK